MYSFKTSKKISVFLLLFFLLFSQAVFAQDFSSIDTDLQALENLINDTIASTEEQQRLLQDLRTSLDMSGNLIAGYESRIQEQENLLSNLRVQLNEMSETYRMQSQLSQRYEQKLKFWKTFSIIAIPAAALISGVVVWAAGR